MRNIRNQRERAVALLSGGLDSTVSLALALEFCTVETAIFFDYGQHASSMEERAARRIADHYGIGFERFALPWLAAISSSSLIAGRGEPPHLSPEGTDSAAPASSGTVWVENRNGIFINIAAAVAAERDCQLVITGFNTEEALNFPDNSVAFLEGVNSALEFGVSKPVRVTSPTVTMNKREIVAEGLRLRIPWDTIWSCYRGRTVMCGDCESCLRLRGAVAGTEAESGIRFAKG